tara:strand:- start:83 stop:409 length:327 start_codon:yes stop_codon:yes gene_type:complete
MKVIELIEYLNGIENKELQVDIKLDEVCEGEEEQIFLDIYSEYILDVPSVLRYEVPSVSEDGAKQLIFSEYYIDDMVVKEIDKLNAKVISKKEYKVVITNKTRVKNYE